MHLMKTETYEVVIGLIPGYKPGKEIKRDDIPFNIDDISKICQDLFSDNPVVVISGIIEECKVVYPIRWGAPKGGEYCFKVSFIRNPIIGIDKYDFRKAVLYNIRMLKKYFKQKTVSLTMHDNGETFFKVFSETKDFEEFYRETCKNG